MTINELDAKLNCLAVAWLEVGAKGVRLNRCKFGSKQWLEYNRLYEEAESKGWQLMDEIKREFNKPDISL